MINKIAVGHRIAALRKEPGYSQGTLAEKLNVTAQAVSKWETGLALPDIEVLLNISWIFNVSIHTILEGESFLESRNGFERGLMHASKILICPQCHGGLIIGPSKKQNNISFSCNNGHRYHLVDGVIHFGCREVEGELWSLWLRNYDHYLEEQRHPGNPRYWQGDPHYREIMWQKIQQLRPRVILDAACGTGSGIKYMIERINWPTTIIMADLSHRILKWNRLFYTEEWSNPYVDMVYLACDCSQLPLDSNSIDMVFSNGGFESMQFKMMDGFREALRVLKPGAQAVYNISAVDDPNSSNTKKWVALCKNLDKSCHIEENMHDIDQWLSKCQEVGFIQNDAVKVYDELPVPTDDTFPFENEVLQWMAEYVVVSKK